MILTMDLNPSTDRRYFVEKIDLNNEIKAKSSTYNPGGNGVTIARLLGIFNESTLITGFLGGTGGEFYHRRLVEAGIIHRVISIKDETRTRVEILDEEKNITTISDNGPRITREEIVEFYELYSRLIDESKIIIGSGTLPQGISKDIFFDLITMCNRKEKIFILDVAGEELLEAIDASPHIVVISKKDLENLVNLELNFENEIIRAGRYILDKGVKILVINLQEKGIIVLEDSTGYRLELEDVDLNIDRVDNSGIVSGLALAIRRSYDYEMTFKLAQAFSLAYSMEEDINRIEMSDIKKIMGEIEIYPINH